MGVSAKARYWLNQRASWPGLSDLLSALCDGIPARGYQAPAPLYAGRRYGLFSRDFLVPVRVSTAADMRLTCIQFRSRAPHNCNCNTTSPLICASCPYWPTRWLHWAHELSSIQPDILLRREIHRVSLLLAFALKIKDGNRIV